MTEFYALSPNKYRYLTDKNRENKKKRVAQKVVS